ncbi:MAG: tRNA guanosine(34) transglycosylase Tgt [Elusimicrobia bacterium]|nr:tRNA guanosine(34) transglycosylase Tgt [Elusimicrobiota bacterium]
MSFTVEAKDPKTRARAGRLTTRRGGVATPVFMPVATQASVKALAQEDLETLGAGIILANSYHLYLRPGCAAVEAAGGLGRFMTYGGSILTDSGGFQVWSLSGLRKVEEEGVTFTSHLDGSRHVLTPESVIEVQARLGSDIWTALDECPSYPCAEAEAERSLARTQRWAERARGEFLRRNALGPGGALYFPILQGSVYPALRRRSAEHALGLSPDGICIGGMSVGEPKELMWATLERAVEPLPEDKPRYLMGVGAPDDLWEAVGRGVDMMDCVFPTRVARNGTVLVRGGRLNIGNARFKTDPGPLDPACGCWVCKRYSRSYLSHLMRASELSSHRYLSYHNMHYTMELMREIRASIVEGRFSEARDRFFDRGNSARNRGIAESKT